jgi:hypothetical protein
MKTALAEPGGAIEFILEAKGILDQAIERYMDEQDPLPARIDIGKGGF